MLLTSLFFILFNQLNVYIADIYLESECEYSIFTNIWLGIFKIIPKAVKEEFIKKPIWLYLGIFFSFLLAVLAKRLKEESLDILIITISFLLLFTLLIIQAPLLQFFSAIR